MHENRLGSLRRNAPAILASLVICYESITKGWLSLLAIPSLLVSIPVLRVVQSGAMKFHEQGKASRSISGVAKAQLFGLLATYVCLPGVGDTSEYLMFGVFMIDIQNPLGTAMWFCSAAGGAVAIVSTVAFFVLRGKGSIS